MNAYQPPLNCGQLNWLSKSVFWKKSICVKWFQPRSLPIILLFILSYPSNVSFVKSGNWNRVKKLYVDILFAAQKDFAVPGLKSLQQQFSHHFDWPIKKSASPLKVLKNLAINTFVNFFFTESILLICQFLPVLLIFIYLEMFLGWSSSTYLNSRIHIDNPLGPVS